MKKIISVFLAVLMIAGCMAISFSASAEDHLTIAITVKAPAIDESPDTENVTITPIKYAQYFSSCAFFTKKNDQEVEVTGAFKAAQVYCVKIWVNDNYSAEAAEDFRKANWTVNGKAAEYEYIMDGTSMITYSFDALPVPEINFTVTAPKAGEQPDTGSLTVTPAKYAKYFTECTFFTKNGDKEEEVTGAFEAGKTYYVKIWVNSNYSAEAAEDFRIAKWTVNGKAAEYEYIMDGTSMITFTFDALPAADPQPEPQPENLCKWCGKVHEGFFQKIIGFFHNILAAIFGAKY